MAAVFAFLGMLLISIVVALLVVLQLGDFFGAGGEFPLVLAAVVSFSILSLAIFAAVYAAAPHARIVAGIGLLLGVLALLPAVLPGLIQKIADRSTNPYTIGIENTYITIELIVPALMAVLVQWGLVRRRFLRTRGEDELTLWPWVTTAIACLVILNPLGLAFVSETLKREATDFLWEFTAAVTGGVVAVLLVMAWIECYIRDRVLHRRRRASLIDGPPAQESTHG